MPVPGILVLAIFAFVPSQVVDANCTALVINRGNTNLNSTDYLIGAAVSFTCPTGYIFSDNSFEKTAFCQANSQWSGNVNTQDFYCRACPVPFSIANADMNVTGTTYTWTCRPGFVFPDQSNTTTYQCFNTNNVLRYTPAASAIPRSCNNGCKDIVNYIGSVGPVRVSGYSPWPVNESIPLSTDKMNGPLLGNTTDTAFGTYVFVDCPTDFDLKGPAVVMCKTDGQWNGNPSCPQKMAVFPLSVTLIVCISVLGGLLIILALIVILCNAVGNSSHPATKTAKPKPRRGAAPPKAHYSYY